MISQEGVYHKVDPLIVPLDLTKSKSLSTNTIFDVQTSDVSRDSIMLVFGREGGSLDEMGMRGDRVDPAN